MPRIWQVNNAIVPHSPPVSTQCASLLEVSEDTWEGLVSVGFKGYFFACQRAAKHMLAQQRGGSIICLSSVHAVNPCECAALLATVQNTQLQ